MTFDAGRRPWLWALSEDALDISFAVQHGDDLKRRAVGPINNGVVGIAGQRPEPKRARCKVGAGMAAQGAFGKKGASVVNRLFDAAGGVLAVLRDVRPDVENIGFGKRRERVTAHRLGKRSCCQLSFIA